MIKNQKHSFHLVDPSPWPMISGISALMLTYGFVLYMHGYSGGAFFMAIWVSNDLTNDVCLVERYCKRRYN